MTSRIFFKLLAAFIVVIAAATATLDFSIRRAWEKSLTEEIQRNLTQKVVMFANRVQTDRQHSLQDIAARDGKAAGARATIIDTEGKVLADSEADASTMENHSRRTEFAAALHGSVGSETRRSHTLGIPFLYVAAPIPGGAVRLAYPLSDVAAMVRKVRRTLLLSSALAFLVALILAGIAAQTTASRLQRIVEFADRIATGDLTARIEETSSDEIGHVAAALDKTGRRLEQSFAALQTSQRQLETLLNSMQDAVIAVGNDGRVQWANQGMNRLVQRSRLNAPLIETVRDPDFVTAMREAAEQKSVRTARAASIVPGHAFDVKAAPMPGGGAVAVLRDLTEIERIEKTRRDFIANVSHELRTPLTSIQGYAETLLDSSSEGDHAREFLEIIRKNAARMSRLTEDLLTLARVESGEHRFDTQPTSPGEMLQEAVESFREIARAQNVELIVENSSDAAVNADREAIHQVFANLLDNALKYAASGNRIVLGARPSERGIEFYVQDFGPGIPSEHLPRLFERFYRIDKARSRESGGTGLGLAIAKHIVLAHGGTIRAESELNHGSTFLFTLPAGAEADAVSQKFTRF
ncbi:MAG: two-component sensor histidine kinase [Acidobacteria bacterium]|nr:MAG: two-component sensor histidine kinase [Acidobacteriota bacterium]PYY10130.1 MAG: two-component sensor histidine kinase [Acidobacteriota bacterium]